MSYFILTSVNYEQDYDTIMEKLTLTRFDGIKELLTFIGLGLMLLEKSIL